MRALIFIIVLCLVVGVILFQLYRHSKTSSMAERVQFTTEDGIQIVADFYPVSGSSKGIILLHMMPADRASWIPFAKKLASAGIQVLAIDLRGHGESQGGPSGWEKFNDVEHQSSYKDIKAAEQFLRTKGVIIFHLAGASIGANLALWYLAQHSYIRSAILLSPGFNYRGIETKPLVSQIDKLQSVYFVGSAEDERSSGQSAADTAKALFSLCPSEHKELKTFSDAGHGTTMLERTPAFIDILTDWILKQG